MALWKIDRHPKAVPALLEMLRHGDPSQAYAAAVALGQMEEEADRLAPALIEALHAPAADVRRAAARSLGQLGKAAFPALKKANALQDPDAEVRRMVIEALSWMGPDAVPALIAALKDSAVPPFAVPPPGPWATLAPRPNRPAPRWRPPPAIRRRTSAPPRPRPCSGSAASDGSRAMLYGLILQFLCIGLIFHYVAISDASTRSKGVVRFAGAASMLVAWLYPRWSVVALVLQFAAAIYVAVYYQAYGSRRRRPTPQPTR